MKETRKREQASEPQIIVLRAIRDYTKRHGIPPTYDDLAKLLVRGKSVIRRSIDRLIAKGLLKRGPGLFRNLVITEQGMAAAKNGRRKRRTV